MNTSFADPVVSIIIRNYESNMILLQKRRKIDDPFNGYWELPQGRIEKNELMLDTASRELIEETELYDFKFDGLYFQEQNGTEKVQYLNALIVSESGKASYLAVCLIGTAKGEAKSSKESSEPTWFTINDILNIVKMGEVFPLNVPMLKNYINYY